MVKLVGKTKSAPYAATPENSDQSGSRATVILKGNRLGGDNCCGGAVRRNGDRVRVNVWLTDLQTARDIWSDRFDGDRTNLAVLQDNITARLLCVAHLHLRQYEEAIGQCSRSLNMSARTFKLT
jgi:hypothetical protein